MRRSPTRRPLTALAAVATLTLLSSCTTGGQEAAGGTTATVTIDAPNSMDPRKALALPDFQLARLSYDTLVRRDDGGLVPGLAATWKATPSRVDFTLREGATCADGTAITARIVSDSINSFVKNGEASTLAAIFGGTRPTATADGASTVVVETDAPWAELAQAFSVAATGIVCPKGLADDKALAGGPVDGSASGPYTLTSFEKGVRYVYTLRDDYTTWPKWRTKLDGTPPKTVEYLVAPDPSATANMVMSGDLDLARIMPDSRTRFDGSPDVTLTSYPFGTFFLVFNERKGSPFADRAKRAAVARAVDRKALNQSALDGTGALGVTLANPGNTCVPKTNDSLIGQDPEAAARALDGVKIRILGAQVIGSGGAGNVYLQEVLRKAGAEVELDNVDIGTWVSKAFSQPNTWDMTIFPDLNFLGSLANTLPLFLGPDVLEGGPNLGGVNNTVTSDAFDQARADTDETSRCALYNKATDALIERADAVPLVTEQYIYAQREGFKVYMLGGSLDDHIFRITG
ncbi:ABC transporter substrate-binding protein [Streptomyces sp. CAI-85]|uniref:ABC transporter substrate-binding protein n=1 Tax=Streptomyces sp. CAI-85 TaxID=1472662 RepID=UPI001587DB41|nr:ABC transporter substrate-binding protein [Streptomyces sp. CAI-85]NUV62719.1 ABC transporter substrate-binding protein [Streptomyces sp. CAI-85]